MSVPIHRSPFKQSTIEQYTEGGCFRLARELHFLTGKPLVKLEEIHTAIYIDDEESLILDVEGIWTASQWQDRWGIFEIHGEGLVTITSVEPDWYEPKTDSLKAKTHDVLTIAPMLIAFAKSLGYLQG